MTFQVPLGKSKLIGILAHPAAHVRAPNLYTPAFWNAGLDWHLIPFDVAPRYLADTIRAFSRMENMLGLNITMPHKAHVYELCTEVGPAAEFEGVVNTVRFENGQLIGDSFDGAGFVGALKASGGFDTERRAVVIGAGGAGRAIVHALAEAGYQRIGILNRDMSRARYLADYLSKRYPMVRTDTKDDLSDAGLVVNATSLGLHSGDPLPADPALIADNATVFDIIAARDTEFMCACNDLNLNVIGGQPMIEHQIGLQVAFWKGVSK